MKLRQIRPRGHRSDIVALRDRMFLNDIARIKDNLKYFYQLNHLMHPLTLLVKQLSILHKHDTEQIDQG